MTIRCSAACSLNATLTVDAATARRLKLGRKATKIAAASRRGVTGTTTLKLRLT